MSNTIITINRECGSGGGSIARLLGEKLGLKVYGRTFIEKVADEFGITMENMDQIMAQKANWWNDICRMYQQFGAASYTSGTVEPTPLSLYYAESRLLRELAEKESCIIVGRAGFHIFRDTPNAHHILIVADRDARIRRIAEKEHLDTDEAAKVVDRIDRERDTFVKNVADTSRLDAHNYDICINVTGLTPENVSTVLAQNIRHKTGF